MRPLQTCFLPPLSVTGRLRVGHLGSRLEARLDTPLLLQQEVSPVPLITQHTFIIFKRLSNPLRIVYGAYWRTSKMTLVMLIKLEHKLESTVKVLDVMMYGM
jgi:hypothetical protein